MQIEFYYGEQPVACTTPMDNIIYAAEIKE